MKRLQSWILVLAVAAPLALTGCKNNNLFGGLHREGSGDAASLLADGQTALATGNFAAALDYFSRALDQNPNSADALYGAAVAQMGLSGLDIGQLVSNVLTQNGTLAPALHHAYTVHGAPAAIHVTNNSLLEGIDIQRLDDALGGVIPKLERIRMGQAQGEIAANDTNLLINLGLVRLLRAASRPIRNNQMDILVNGDAYEVTVNPAVDCNYVDASARNVAWGYRYLAQAAAELEQTSGDLIFDLKDDINNLFDEIYNQPETAGCTPVGVSASAVPGVVNPDADGLNP